MIYQTNQKIMFIELVELQEQETKELHIHFVQQMKEIIFIK